LLGTRTRVNRVPRLIVNNRSLSSITTFHLQLALLVPVAIINQLHNAFEYLCREYGFNNDLKVAQFIETELDAAATDEELNKHFKR